MGPELLSNNINYSHNSNSRARLNHWTVPVHQQPPNPISIPSVKSPLVSCWLAVLPAGVGVTVSVGKNPLNTCSVHLVTWIWVTAKDIKTQWIRTRILRCTAGRTPNFRPMTELNTITTRIVVTMILTWTLEGILVSDQLHPPSPSPLSLLSF